MLQHTRNAALGAALALCAASCGPAQGEVFLAQAADFQNYHSWQRFDLGVDDALGHSTGQRYVYMNRAPPPGSREFPVGTILIKVMEDNPDPTYWELFGMARRGGGFNAAGLPDWEYFLLRVDPTTSEVTIEGRGADPVGADNYGGFGSSGAGCNLCHGTEAARARDGLLSDLVYDGTLGAGH